MTVWFYAQFINVTTPNTFRNHHSNNKFPYFSSHSHQSQYCTTRHWLASM